MNKHFLSITDFTKEEIWQILSLSLELKKQFKEKGFNKPVLANKSLAMFFEKPSLRTKLSFDIAMHQLGGHSVYFSANEVGLGVRESIQDISHVVSGMVDILMARTNTHTSIQELAQYSEVPVINGLSDREHPCQILADLLTICECKATLSGLKIAFVGDGENNVTHSLALSCALLGIDFICASPSGYFMESTVFITAKKLSNKRGSIFMQVEDPLIAVEGADVVYTDTWVSMGDETESKKRVEALRGYQVDTALMNHAKKDALFMHDMPAYRGKEVTSEVIDGPQSVVYQQAENRLHAQKGLLVKLMGKELFV